MKKRYIKTAPLDETPEKPKNKSKEEREREKIAMLYKLADQLKVTIGDGKNVDIFRL